MIKSSKELAQRLTEGQAIELKQISVRLSNIVKLWERRKEITINNNIVSLNR